MSFRIEKISHDPKLVFIILVYDLYQLIKEVVQALNEAVNNDVTTELQTQNSKYMIVDDLISFAALFLVVFILYKVLLQMKEYRRQIDAYEAKMNEYQSYMHDQKMVAPRVHLSRAETTYLMNWKGEQQFLDKILRGKLKEEYDSALIRVQKDLNLKTSEAHRLLEEYYGYDLSQLEDRVDL